MMPTIEDVLDLSEEVKNRHVKGNIELYKLISSGDEFEKNSEAIFNCTYPTGPIRSIVEFITRKMDPEQKADVRSAFAITGTYGTGKSHILATIYHLFNGLTRARTWLEKNDMIQEMLPTFPRTVVLPMLNLKR